MATVAPVVGLQVTPADYEVLLSWTATPDADQGYDVARNGRIIAQRVQESFYIDDGVETEALYTYRVRVHCPDNDDWVPR